MSGIRRGAIGLTIFLAVGSAAPAWARTTSASINTFLPAIDDSKYLSIYSSQTLQQWQFRTGAYFHYALNPLEVGLGGVRRTGVVDHLFVGDFFGAVGITDWFQLGLSAPVALYEDFNNVAAGTSETVIRMMDVRFEPKFRLLDIDRHSVGISVVPFLLAPTGAGSRLVGNNSFAGGAKAVVDFDIKHRVQISTNLGYFARDRVVILNTEVDDMFTYGLGINVKTVSWLDLIAEAYGATNATDFFARESELPLEVDGGLRFNLPKPEGLQITVGGGMGLTFGYGSPDFRGILGVSYLKPRRVELPIPPPPPQEEALAKVEKKKIVITKRIHFEFDKAVIRPISFRILDAVVDILKTNSDIRKVRVEGHCDYKGSDAYNMRLSQRRANAVRDYLMAHGVEADRLVAVGYGESRPIATNETAEGRARNRRVEFTILEQEGVAPDGSEDTSSQ